MQKRDWDLLAEESLWSNYWEFARTVTAQAALDYIATRYPKTTDTYIMQWYKNMHGNPSYNPSKERLAKFAREERRKLREYFDNGGGSVAEMANCKEYVLMATCGKPSRKVLGRISELKKTYHRYFDTKIAKQKEPPPARHCLDCGIELKTRTKISHRCRSCARRHTERLKRTAKIAVKKEAENSVCEQVSEYIE